MQLHNDGSKAWTVVGVLRPALVKQVLLIFWRVWWNRGSAMKIMRTSSVCQTYSYSQEVPHVRGSTVGMACKPIHGASNDDIKKQTSYLLRSRTTAATICL